MKKIATLLLFASLSFMTFGWGQTGHRVTGHIASKYLTKKTRKALDLILGGQSLAMASTWMDEIRSDSTFDYMTDWHWVTIPDGMTYEAASKNPNGDIIQTLERVIEELKSGKLSPPEEATRIRILIHLVGDIHQPLHVGRPDRGGNDIKVQWFRTDSNLHRVWDSDMIDGTQLSYTELAESIILPSAALTRKLQQASVRDWATESMTFRAQIYDIGTGRLGYSYAYKNLDTVRERLMKAGIRLAGLLNEIYGGKS
jgi:hypothetical protein